jgi:hypothetical protein
MDASAAQAPFTTKSPLANGQSLARAKYEYSSLSGGKKRFLNEPGSNGVFPVGCRIGRPAFQCVFQLDKGAVPHTAKPGPPTVDGLNSQSKHKTPRQPNLGLMPLGHSTRTQYRYRLNSPEFGIQVVNSNQSEPLTNTVEMGVTVTNRRDCAAEQPFQRFGRYAACAGGANAVAGCCRCGECPWIRVSLCLIQISYLARQHEPII